MTPPKPRYWMNLTLHGLRAAVHSDYLIECRAAALTALGDHRNRL